MQIFQSYSLIPRKKKLRK